jgi:hypothetical protein
MTAGPQDCRTARQQDQFPVIFFPSNLNSFFLYKYFSGFPENLFVILLKPELMTLTERIDSFAELGRILRDALEGKAGSWTTPLQRCIERQQAINGWFTPENVTMAISSIASELTDEKLRKWTSAYPAIEDDPIPSRVAVIMAGNIPLVGFHDFISVLITGQQVMVKTSSKDPELILLIRDILISLNRNFREYIAVTTGTLQDFDAVIATGSDNTSRYFEFYFGKYPSIIRKNRNSIAILDGTESFYELEALGEDIFTYFGLGCRNVSKVFIPGTMNAEDIFAPLEGFRKVIDHSKYSNNYDFNKAVYLVNREKFSDNGFLLLKESTNLSSPVAVLYYENYNNIDDLEKMIDGIKGRIQCIIGKNHINFGNSQKPALWDYADDRDTIDFLLKKINRGIL